ncbi:hypothetical protein BH23PLA1_BH23PLA1_38850 [soil metagenome]
MRRRWINVRKRILRTLLPALRLLPPRAATKMVGDIGRVEYALVPGLRASYNLAIAREGRHFGDPWDVKAVGRELAANQVRSRTRDLLLDGRSDRQIAELFIVNGRETLDEAVARKKGVILLGNHFGAHLLTACWLIRQGYDWRMYGERPRHVSRLLARQFELGGPLGQDRLFISRKTNPAEAAGAILRAARVLKAEMVLSIAADVRWSGPLTCPATFLGRTYHFSATWVTLAALTGAPVVPAYCRMDRDGTYHVDFDTAFQIPPKARDISEASEWVQLGLRLIEDRVQNDPANSNDYFFWADDEQAGPRLEKAG